MTNNIYKNIYGSDKNVEELILSDFIYKNKKLYINNKLFNNNKGLIIFYAPWCKHCKEISELIIELALANINLFNFGAVNYENLEDKNDILCNYANIKNFPKIKYIKKNGELVDYKYEYTADNLIYFINTN
jgi:thiol-disulfide isomerase/thioredoxin